MAGLKSRMVTGSLWLAGARGVVNSLGLISTIVLARLLAPADFGLVALGTSFMAIVTALTEMSMAQALIHHRDPDEDYFHSAWTLNMLRGLALAALMVLAAGPLAAFYDEPQLAMVVYALSASVLISGLINPRQVALLKQMVFWQQFTLSVTQNVVIFIVSMTVAIVWQNYWALVAGILAGQVVYVALSYAMLPFLPKIRLNRARALWSFSLWLMLGNAINTINWRSDQLLVGGLLGAGTLGQYTVGDNLAQIPTREAIAPLRDTLFPALAQMADNPPRLAAAYQNAQGMITFVALPVGVGFALVAEPVVVTAMGAKWLPAVPVVQALSAVFALQTLGSMVRPLSMARGETRGLFWRDLLMFTIRVPIVIGATLLLGLQGLIFSRIFTGLFGIGVNVTLVRQLIGISVREQILVNWRSLTAALVMTAAVLGTHAALGSGVPSDIWHAAALLVQLCLVGALAYPAAAFALWFMCGRPGGAEAEAIGMARTVLSRIGLVLPGKANGS